MFCKYINIVWIERGIILSIIEYILENYYKLMGKKIIIDDKRYRYILRPIFPKLVFSAYINDEPKNFYINIRKIIKNQDIVIDYLNNYNNFILGDNVKLVPYYDYNDMLIMYEVSKKKRDINFLKNNFINFSLCVRGNFYGNAWDHTREKTILFKFQLKFGMLWYKLFQLINFSFRKYSNPKYFNIIQKEEKKCENNSNIKTYNYDEKELEKILRKIQGINNLISNI